MARIKKSIDPVFDYEGKILNKDEMIKREAERMKGLISEVAPEQLPVVKPVIESLAFQTVALKELEEILKLKGFTEEYQNGANQCGIKESSESRSYNALAKTCLGYRKQLMELIQKNAAKADQDELMAFLSGN